ncbi:MAG: hypothetical protein KJ792_06860 [Actinobacteria bacterium]|nr:hypothetical protein [Actinomycetota bacterium]MCG2802589.1 hypothetical protein [Cellulomonas sp.]
MAPARTGRRLNPEEDVVGGSILPLVAFVLLVAIAVAVLAVVSTPSPATSDGDDGRADPQPLLGAPSARRARRHLDRVTVLAWLTFAAATGVSWLLVLDTGPGAGLVAALAPAAIGTLFLLVHLLGEITWPRPDGPVRRATLRHRQARHVIGTGLAVWAGTLGTVLVATLLATGFTADADGRAVSRTWPAGSSSAGPYPGWHYAVPLLGATAVVVLLTGLVLRLVVLRAAVDGAHEEDDLALRRSSGARVLAGAQLVLGLTAAGVLLVTGSAVRSIGLTPSGAGGPSGGPLAAVGTVLALAGPAIGLTSAVVAVVALVRSGARVAAPATVRG